MFQSIQALVLVAACLFVTYILCIKLQKEELRIDSARALFTSALFINAVSFLIVNVPFTVSEVGNVWFVVIALVAVKVFVAKTDPFKNLLLFVFLFPFFPFSTEFFIIGPLPFVRVNYVSMMSIIFLGPVALRLLVGGKTKYQHTVKVDVVFIGLLLIYVLGSLREQVQIVGVSYPVTFFSATREILGYVLIWGIPAFVAVRAITNRYQLKQIFIALAIGTVFLSVGALVEVGRGWKFYQILMTQLTGTIPYDQITMFYEVRGGILRTTVTSLGPLSLGMHLTIGLGLWLFLFRSFKSSFFSTSLVLILIFVAIFTTGSRAAWAGGLIVLMIFIFLRSNAILKVLIVAMVAVGGGAYQLSNLSPTKQSIEITDEYNTFNYRAQLFAQSLKVIPKNPFFGTRKFRDDKDMLELVQGQGIIDMVNTYVHIAVEYGLIALALFMILWIRMIYYSIVMIRTSFDDFYSMLGASYIAISFSVMLQIASLSFVDIVQFMIFAMFALMRSAYFMNILDKKELFKARQQQIKSES